MSKLQEFTKKKSVRIGAAAVTLIGIAAIAQSGLDFNQETPRAKKVKQNLVQSNVFDTAAMEKIDTDTAQATYEQMKKDMHERSKQEQQLRDSQNRELNKVMTQLTKMQEQLATQNQIISVLSKNNQVVSGAVNDPRITRARQSGVTGENGVTTPAGTAQGPYSTLTPQQYQNVSRASGPVTNGMIRTVSQNKITNIKKTGQVEETPIEVVYVESRNGGKNAGKAQAQPKKPTNPEIEKKKRDMVKAKAKTYIPAGSIISGVMLNGVDAPTALSKNASPLPTTIRVKLDVLMPNSYNADLADCFVIGSVTGDLASERAYIRSVTMSCINERGESLETGMIGYAVSDYDGRNGIRGTVVSRAGKALIATFGASFLSAVAEASKPTAIPSLDQNPGDTTAFQTPNMGDVGKSGIMGGVAGGSDRLAQYAIAIADQQWPVIEISPGTPVTFFLEKGMSLPVVE
ncbi:hypothetical protein E4188_22790 (plasmid) [Aeromonas media]|uniref:Conjugal transfer protein TraB n=1 Tax=Aeromonas media TaxID=651 RepID=A0ABX6NY59_AERME|nr:TrbI/VirB10 family protein [Aeromonas media]QJT37074.1 hypothetical protein E4187_22550 [Aeromonas media]QJT41327.1 hypothetical protein E4188_22790 [Aeromonas media]